MLLKNNINYHETIHDGAIGIKVTIQDSAVGMKNRFVGHLFLKQAKNRVSDWSFTAVAFSKRVWGFSEQREKERSCICK